MCVAICCVLLVLVCSCVLVVCCLFVVVCCSLWTAYWLLSVVCRLLVGW